jgi:hypothetical protein
MTVRNRPRATGHFTCLRAAEDKSILQTEMSREKGHYQDAARLQMSVTYQSTSEMINGSGMASLICFERRLPR